MDSWRWSKICQSCVLGLGLMDGQEIVNAVCLPSHQCQCQCQKALMRVVVSPIIEISSVKVNVKTETK
jgi:hypothetical protein